jgi:hypothetical protein
MMRRYDGISQNKDICDWGSEFRPRPPFARLVLNRMVWDVLKGLRQVSVPGFPEALLLTFYDSITVSHR